MYGVHRYGKANPFYGKTLSPESIEKMKKSFPNRKKENHPSWGEKMSAESIEKTKKNAPDRRGKKHPLYGKKGKNSPNYGGKRSDAQRERMSIAGKKAWAKRRLQNDTNR